MVGLQSAAGFGVLFGTFIPSRIGYHISMGYIF